MAMVRATPDEQAALNALRSRQLAAVNALNRSKTPKRRLANGSGGIAARQHSGEKLSILDHTAISYFLRRNVQLPQEQRDSAIASLTQSWKDLTGKRPQ